MCCRGSGDFDWGAVGGDVKERGEVRVLLLLSSLFLYVRWYMRMWVLCS